MNAQVNPMHSDAPRLHHELEAQRVVVGLVVAAVGIACVFSHWSFDALVIAIAVLGAFELATLARLGGAPISLPVAIAGSAAFIGVGLFPLQLGAHQGWIVAAILGASAIAGLRTRDGDFSARGRWLARGAATSLATLYLGKLFSFYILLRGPLAAAIAPRAWSPAIAVILWIIVVVVLTDTVSMVAGLAFGRTRLWPRVSPSKTWEGALAGFAAATGAGAAYCVATGIRSHWLEGVALSGALSAAAIAGDLVESALKRWANVKDSGRLIAGHGGVLDRFDSYIFAGYVAYWGLLVARPA